MFFAPSARLIVVVVTRDHPHTPYRVVGSARLIVVVVTLYRRADRIPTVQAPKHLFFWGTLKIITTTTIKEALPSNATV
jgi:hypothetical protein